MSTYRVTGQLTITMDFEIEAESEEDAIRQVEATGLNYHISDDDDRLADSGLDFEILGCELID